MREAHINGHKVVVYDSIEETNIVRFQKFNQFVLVDSGIGSDTEAVTRHLNEIIAYNKAGEVQKVENAALSMIQAISLVMKGENPKVKSFATMIHSINGVPTELTETGIAATIAELNRIRFTVGDVRKMLAELKKKSIRKLRSFFQLVPIRRKR